MSDFGDDLDKFKKQVNKFTDMKRLNERETVTLARAWVEKIKEEIARGLSPLTRKKFPKYKDPERYPGDRKAHAPVNLELSGDFLADLKVKNVITSGKQIVVNLGYGSQKSRNKELGHRDGANGQPKRPTLPEGNEDFSSFLNKELTAAYVKLIEKFDV